MTSHQLVVISFKTTYTGKTLKLGNTPTVQYPHSAWLMGYV